MIGSSDGKMYESPFDLALGRAVEPSEKPTGASKSPDPTQVAPIVDRTKDVPLAASALHKNGEMYGIAIDKDAPIRPEYDQYIYKHEADEFAYMKDLITNGMQPGEAYHKAHDHITPMESARVQADLGEKGLEDYKQYWRDVASNSTQKENPDRHPDAHTTTYGLDEKELGRKFSDPPEQKEALFRGLKGAGITATDAQFQPLNPMQPGYSNPGGHSSSAKSWYRGAEGKWRQEISDVDSKLKTNAFRKETFIDQNKWDVADSNVEHLLHVRPDTTLEEIFHHPELYASYPGLRDVKIHPVSKGDLKQNIKGWSDGIGNIGLAPMSEEKIHSTLLHEIQHMIQEREGFTRGASPRSMVPYVAKAMDNVGLDPRNISREELADAVHKSYEAVAGEVEARNVQFRHKHPLAAERFKPELTEDVPRDLQLNPPK